MIGGYLVIRRVLVIRAVWVISAILGCVLYGLFNMVSAFIRALRVVVAITVVIVIW